MIKLQNVTVKYVREYYALLGYNAEIDASILLLGDNGKVILRLLAKMDKFDGDIFYDGINLKDIKNCNLPFAYLPETPVLFKHKSLYKNLIFPLKLRKVKNADEIVENAIITHLSFLVDKIKFKTSTEKITNSIATTDKKVNESEINASLQLNSDESKSLNKNLDDNFNNLNQKSINLNNEILQKIEKLKVNKLNKHEQQILCLLRAVIRQPKYLLIDNLFSTLPTNYHSLAATILNQYTGTIIASENKQFDFYKNFNTMQVDN